LLCASLTWLNDEKNRARKGRLDSMAGNEDSNGEIFVSVPPSLLTTLTQNLNGSSTRQENDINENLRQKKRSEENDYRKLGKERKN
jgi:hypothetical protein